MKALSKATRDTPKPPAGDYPRLGFLTLQDASRVLGFNPQYLNRRRQALPADQRDRIPFDVDGETRYLHISHSKRPVVTWRALHELFDR